MSTFPMLPHTLIIAHRINNDADIGETEKEKWNNSNQKNIEDRDVGAKERLIATTWNTEETCGHFGFNFSLLFRFVKFSKFSDSGFIVRRSRRKCAANEDRVSRWRRSSIRLKTL